MSSQALASSLMTPFKSPERPNDVAVDSAVGVLQSDDRLLLQQLLQCRYWQEKHGLPATVATPTDKIVGGHQAVSTPDRWELTRGLSLHDWQRQCVEGWFGNGRKGVIKVVTGAGKTILALAISERLQQIEVADLRVAIVVPTVVLLEQWRDEFAARSNLPPRAIGLMGGGHNDRFNEHVKVLICVLNSASKKLAEEVERTGVAGSLLLIVDECHRAGAAEMQNVFRTRRAFSLGLSATPERSDDLSLAEHEAEGLETESVDGSPPSFEETVLGRELGNVFFEMNYAEAIRKGVLPPFRITHYGLTLQPKERERYEYLSREIKELRQELETGKRRGLALVRWCRSRAGAADPRAAQFLALTVERKRLLYRMTERAHAVSEILSDAFRQNPDTKAILFHESIEEVMAIFDRLRREGLPVVAEHSDFLDAMRAESLRLFRCGIARVIVSAKSLIEGFNVPAADLGIVVAASASVRQRVQTLGRLLRRNRRPDGSEKQATLYVLYASGTVDELIYEKADWEQFVGADRNDYLIWPQVGQSRPVVRGGPPRRPPLDESAVPISDLRPGEPYPGNADQGRLYSLDTQGTVRDEHGVLIQPHSQLWSVLSPMHRSGGRFRITPQRRFVIRLEKNRDGWRSVYLGQLDTAVQAANSGDPCDQTEIALTPGGSYPLTKVRGTIFSVLQRDKRLIAKKNAAGVRFVIPAEQLEAPTKAEALRVIQKQLATAYARGHRINKITVTPEGHVVYVFQNEAFYVGNAPEGPAGFLFD